MKASMVHSTYDIHEDDDHISERLQRFIKTLPFEDDDEIRISSTGQILKKKDLYHHHEHTNRKYSPKSNIRRSDDICSDQSKFVGSHSNIKQITTRFICTALPYSNNNGVVVTMYMILGATLYHFIQRFISKSSCKSKYVHQTSIDPKNDTTTTPIQQERQQSSTIVTVTTSTLSKGNEDNVPPLIPECNTESSSNEKIVNACTLSTTPPTKAIVSFPISTPLDDAQQAVSLVSTFEKVCTEAGLDCDRNMAWKWAMKQQTTDKIIQAQQMEELRRYVYDRSQRTVDRKLSQQYHEDNVTTAREDKDWLMRLTNVLDKCYSALIQSLYHCFAGMFIIIAARPILFMVHAWYTLSSTEMICYGSETSFDPKIYISKPSWYERYSPTFTYFDLWTTLTLGEATTCAKYTIGRISYLVLMMCTLYIASWIFDQLALPERVPQILRSGLLLLFFFGSDWLPRYHLYQMIFFSVTIVTAGYCGVSYKYYTDRHKFQTIKPLLPQIPDVNECLTWYHDAIGIIRTVPIIALIGFVYLLWN